MEEQHPAVGHVVDVKILAGVFGALIVLTAVTVAATYVDLGAGNLWAAIGIAAVKATLVAMYFMHLRYDHPFNAIVFAASIFFLVVFIGLALVDTLEYKDTVIPDYAPDLDR